MNENRNLTGKVALVAGGTRGASRAIAIELGRLGATVYVSGRTTRTLRSEVDRPESIEDTADLVTEAGGEGIPVRTDHLEPEQVRALVERIDTEQGRLDVLINGLWGGDGLIEWDTPVWEHSLENGLRMIRLGIDSHLITAHFALALLIREPGGLVVDMTDGTAEYNAKYRKISGLPFYVAKTSAHQLAIGQAAELEPYGGTAVAVTPGWLRSEAMLNHFGVTEENWRDAIAQQPGFEVAESPVFVGRGVAALAADPDKQRWSGRTLSSHQLAEAYEVDDLDGSRPNGWAYITEVIDPGKPPNVTPYR